MVQYFFVDNYHRLVFCGDAIGCYLWLFLPFSTSIEKYRNEIERVKNVLSSFADYKYLGGHCKNDGTLQSDISYGTFSDMSVLCDELLYGRTDIQTVRQIPLLSLLYAQNGSAGIVFRKCKLKRKT